MKPYQVDFIVIGLSSSIGPFPKLPILQQIATLDDICDQVQQENEEKGSEEEYHDSLIDTIFEKCKERECYSAGLDRTEY